MTKRQEHIEWARARALAYVERGKVLDAINSFVSDMRKEPETARHPAILEATQLAIWGVSLEGFRRFLEDVE